MDLSDKIDKALTCRRMSNLAGGSNMVITAVPPEVIDAIDEIARDSGTRNRSNTLWNAVMVYLQAYRYTRKGLAPSPPSHLRDV